MMNSLPKMRPNMWSASNYQVLTPNMRTTRPQYPTSEQSFEFFQQKQNQKQMRVNTPASLQVLQWQQIPPSRSVRRQAFTMQAQVPRRPDMGPQAQKLQTRFIYLFIF